MSGIEKPTEQEEEYFKIEEIEQKRRLALKQAALTAAQQREELRKLHSMKCPACGMDLHRLDRGNVEVDTCFNCKGTFIPAGQLEELLKRGPEHAGGVIQAIINLVHPTGK